jgi:hypothetical protein
VRGGPDSFVLSVQAPELLAETIRRKMVQEISQEEPRLRTAKMTKLASRIDCEFGHLVPNMITTP